MPQIQLWILTGVLSLTLAILGAIGKAVANKLVEKLDEIVDELRHQGTKQAVQDQKIMHLEQQNELQNNRLNDHATRIRSLEINRRQS